jgi:hypothetical protein
MEAQVDAGGEKKGWDGAVTRVAEYCRQNNGLSGPKPAAG